MNVPRNKPAGKQRKASAIAPLGEAKKPAAGITQHRKPIPSLEPDVINEYLGCAYEKVVHIEYQLKYHPTFLGQEQVHQIKRISVATKKCLKMLAKNARQNDGTAIDALADLTRIGCEYLNELSQKNARPDEVKAIAAHYPEWPVLLSRKNTSIDEAKRYLCRIGVGSKGSLPTAYKISPENTWTQYASYLIERIKRERGNRRGTRIHFSGARLPQTTNLTRVEKRRRLLTLPAELNKDTWVEWWEIAKEMLKDYWKANPNEAKTALRQVPSTKEIRNKQKKVETLAIRKVRAAFKAIAAKQ